MIEVDYNDLKVKDFYFMYFKQDTGKIIIYICKIIKFRSHGVKVIGYFADTNDSGYSDELRRNTTQGVEYDICYRNDEESQLNISHFFKLTDDEIHYNIVAEAI